MTSCLLIDSNSAERDRIERLLADIGLAFVQLSTPDEGVAYCKENHPDVVLMEARSVPQARDFLRLARHLGAGNGRPVIILYAAEADMELMGESILEGASEFLMKPFDRDLLLFKLRQSGVISALAA